MNLFIRAARLFWCLVRKVGAASQWVAAVGIACGLLLCAFWYFDSHFDGPATTMENARIRGVPVFHSCDNATVEFITTRYKTCSLDVGRFVKRAGGKAVVGDQDHLIDHVFQQFRGDGITRASFYTANLQCNLPPGKYVVFSYGRYVCNPVDYIFLHDIRTDDVPFEIVDDATPIPQASP